MIPHSQFETIVVPMTVVTCPRRPGVEFVSIRFNATEKPHEPIPLTFRVYEKPIHELAVCVGPLYGTESKWLQIVEYVEHYKLLGASCFYFTLFNLNEYDRKMIDYYARMGYAEYTPYLTEYQQLNWMFHLIQTQECHHRSRHHSKWVLNLDTDERVVYTGPGDFLGFLRHYRNVDIDALNGNWLENYSGKLEETKLDPKFEQNLIEAVKQKVNSKPFKRPLKAFILSAYYYPHSKSLGSNALALVMSMNLGRRREKFDIANYLETEDETKIMVMARNRTSAVAVSTHYERYGAHMHLYFISAVSSFFQLLHEYETQGYLTMQPWDRVVFPFVPGVIADVYQEMEFQNLAAAQTDCLLQYKESTKFVALFELNDILIPKLAPTLVEEFQILMAKHPLVSYMSYRRQNFEISISNNTRFSIQSMMNSLIDKNTQKPGRIVINPLKLNYTWIDRPLYVPDGFYVVDVTENVITHLEKIVWENHENMNTLNEKIIASPTFFNVSKHTDNMYKTTFRDIEADLQRMLNKDKVAEIIPNLPNFYYFYDLVNKCFEEKYYRFLRSSSPNWVKNICPGTQMCGFYQHPDINCVHVNAKHDFMKAVEPITYYYATEYFYSSDIGCYAH